jgi:hypothetical protein
MILVLAVFALLSGYEANDTMRYPISGGVAIVQQPDHSNRRGLGVTISVMNDSNVYSCSGGIVKNVLELEQESLVIITSNDTVFVYSMLDSVVVKKGGNISYGNVLGIKKKNKEEIYFIRFQAFIEVKSGSRLNDAMKEINAKKLIIYE